MGALTSPAGAIQNTTSRSGFRLTSIGFTGFEAKHLATGAAILIVAGVAANLSFHPLIERPLRRELVNVSEPGRQKFQEWDPADSAGLTDTQKR